MAKSLGPGFLFIGLYVCFWADDVSVDFSDRIKSGSTLAGIIMTSDANGVDTVTVKGPVPKVGNIDPTSVKDETMVFQPKSGGPQITMNQMSGTPQNVQVNSESGSTQTWKFFGVVNPPV